jgi:hypothetical protein
MGGQPLYVKVQALSFDKTPHQRNLIHVICYTTSPYVIGFKCILDSGEGQPLEACLAITRATKIVCRASGCDLVSADF